MSPAPAAEVDDGIPPLPVLGLTSIGAGVRPSELSLEHALSANAVSTAPPQMFVRTLDGLALGDPVFHPSHQLNPFDPFQVSIRAALELQHVVATEWA